MESNVHQENAEQRKCLVCELAVFERLCNLTHHVALTDARVELLLLQLLQDLVDFFDEPVDDDESFTVFFLLAVFECGVFEGLLV